MKKVALPRIKLKDLGDVRSEEKAQQLEANARKLLRKDSAFSRERAAKLDRADFHKEVKKIGCVKGTPEVRRAKAIFKQLRDTALEKCPAARAYKWKMVVVDDAQPDQGWAYGSGYISITEATARLPITDEIAATIAHEIGHVILDHCRLEWGLNEIVDGLPAARRKSAKRARRMILRRDELEADVFSVRLLKAAGYAPEGAIASLERDLAKDKDLKPEYKHRHPTNAQRIAWLRRELKKMAGR